MSSSPDSSAEPRHQRRSPSANALQDLLAFLYPLALTVVLTPVILHYIGAEQYGIYALASVFVGFIGLLDIGMAPVVVRFLAASLATSNYSEARAVLGVGSAFFTAVGVTGAILAVIGGQVLPHVVSVSPHLRGTAAFVISVAGVGFLVDAIRLPFASIPGAIQRFEVTTFSTLVATTIGAIATVVALSLGGGLRALIVIAVLQSVLSLVLIARGNRRLIPELKIRPRYDRDLLRRMISFSAYTFVSNTAGAILFQIDKFVLGALKNVSVVTYYVVPGNVAQRLHTGMANLTAVGLPVAADLHTRGEQKSLTDFYVRATRASALIVSSLTIPAFVLSRQLLRQWVGEAFASTSFGTLRLLLLTYAALALTTLPYYVTLGIGRPRPLALFNVVTAAVNVVAIVILIPRYGLIGAAVAYLASTVTVPGLIFYVERRVLQLERSPWPGLLVRLGLVAAAQAGLCLLVRPLANGLAQVIGLLLLGAAAGPMLAFVTGYLTAEDRATLTRLLRTRALPRTRPSTDSTAN